MESLAGWNAETRFYIADGLESLWVVQLCEGVALLLWNPAIVFICLRLVDDPNNADCLSVGKVGVDSVGHPCEPTRGSIVVRLGEESRQPFSSQTL